MKKLPSLLQNLRRLNLRFQLCWGYRHPRDQKHYCGLFERNKANFKNGEVPELHVPPVYEKITFISKQSYVTPDSTC